MSVDRAVAGSGVIAPWHARGADAILRALGSSREGLAETVARSRLAQYGDNRLEATPPEPAWRILLAQLRSVIALLLVVAALLALLSRNMADAIAITAVLLLNLAIGFTTEFRARRAIEALVRLGSQSSVVIRDGRERTIDASELVPGDIITVEAGARVPADARLIAATELEIDESVLTGESQAVAKDPTAALDSAVSLPDRTTMVFRGTTVASGIGRAVVVATGMRTEVGRIGLLVRGVREQPTVLEVKLAALGRRLAVIAVVVAIVIALLDLIRGAYLSAVIQTAIAVAVAAVPEGLPAVVTATMAIASRRMARRNALVRRLHSVETLGSVTVICTDKTGTLTEGKQTVTTVWSLDGSVEDIGNASTLRHVWERRSLDSGAGQAPVAHALTIAALSSRGHLPDGSEGGEAYGDPTELALLRLTRNAGAHRSSILEEWPEAGDLPFSSERMLMASYHRSATGNLTAFVKGAADRVLARCDRALSASGEHPLDPRLVEVIESQASAMSAKGLRVLALASGNVDEVGDDALTALRFAALVGLTDPPAEGVAETIATLREAGIRTIMLTGDHKATAIAVGRAVGLLDNRTGVVALAGTEIDAMSDNQLAASLRGISIVSRISPSGKLRVVEALQRTGEVVAMLGDGVNDAAALKKADIGVVMGRRGSDAAKEVAGIILQDDRFKTIAAAVEEGRVVFDNIRKFVFYLFSCNLAEILALFAAGISTTLPLPMTALQILWLNLVTDTFPALALAIEPAESDVMRRPPRDPSIPLLSRRLIKLTVSYSLIISAVTIIALVLGLQVWAATPSRAVTLSFTTLALAQLLHLGNARSRTHVVSKSQALLNRYALAAVVGGFLLQVVAVESFQVSRLLDSVTLTLLGWLLALLLASIPALGGQLWKLRRHVRHSRQLQATHG